MRNQRGDSEITALFVVGAGTVLLLGAIMVVGWFIEYYQCGTRANMMGLQKSWGPIQGCMVKVGDRYAPINYIRIVDDKVLIQGDGE